MTIRKLSPLRTPGVNYQDISGSFLPNGASQITAANRTGFGIGFTVARQSTGVFRVTLDQPVNRFVSIIPSVQATSADANNRSVYIGDSSASGRYFDIIHKVGGTLSDIAAASTSLVHFRVTIAMSDVPGAGV